MRLPSVLRPPLASTSPRWLPQPTPPWCCTPARWTPTLSPSWALRADLEASCLSLTRRPPSTLRPRLRRAAARHRSGQESSADVAAAGLGGTTESWRVLAAPQVRRPNSRAASPPSSCTPYACLSRLMPRGSEPWRAVAGGAVPLCHVVQCRQTWSANASTAYPRTTSRLTARARRGASTVLTAGTKPGTARSPQGRLQARASAVALLPARCAGPAARADAARPRHVVLRQTPPLRGQRPPAGCLLCRRSVGHLRRR